MTNGGSLTESLWRDLIADEVSDWLSRNEVFDDSELVEFILTGQEKESK